MTVGRPCYASREVVMSAMDIALTARSSDQVDRAIVTASDNIDAHLHRKFYPEDKTCFFDWPDYQRGRPWRIRFDANELADVTVNVPVVTSGGTVIPAASIFWEPRNYGPPFTYMELNRGTSAAFSAGSTPQRAVSVAGTFGYRLKFEAAGTLAAAVSTTSATTVAVSDSHAIGTGDLILADAERMLVTGKTMITTAQAQQGAGCSTASTSDVSLGVTDGTKFTVGEVLLLDSERMLIIDIAGNTLTVKRALDGSVLAGHSGATIYAARQLTVARGQLGTAAATHSNAAPVTRFAYPGMIRDLAVAEAINQVLQETSGYSRTVGGPDVAMPASGVALMDKWAEASAIHGRNVRQRVI
jgi:hypothetical protein